MSAKYSARTSSPKDRRTKGANRDKHARRTAVTDRTPPDEEPYALRRRFNTHFLFWTVCPNKMCQRAKSCRGDVRACHTRCWPVMPEEMKVELRAAVAPRVKGLSMADTVREATAEVARWRELEPRFNPPPAAEASDAGDGARAATSPGIESAEPLLTVTHTPARIRAL